MPLRDALRHILGATTVEDARDVYAAIRRAAPGGLGHADAQDIADEPTLTLLEVMRLAANRDGIAREYATAFAATFEIGAPTLARARSDGLCWDDATVETFLTPRRCPSERAPFYRLVASARQPAARPSPPWTPRCAARATRRIPARPRI